jgi:hypothetical protein
VGTSASGRWIAVAAAAAIVAAACALFCTAAQFVRIDTDAAVSGATPSQASPVAEPARRAAATRAAAAPEAGQVDIDDAPFPAGATGTIRGTVRDDLGRPIGDAWISAHVKRTFETPFAYDASAESSLADGTFVISDLDPAAVWRLEGQARGHVKARPSESVAFGSQRTDVTVDVVLPRRGAIEFAVTDTEGRPLQFSHRVTPVDVHVDPWDVDSERLPPGRCRVSVEADGHAGDSRLVDIRPGETTRAEFRLAEEAAISGALLDPDGSPLEKFGVVAVAADQPDEPFTLGATTGADGTFRIGKLRKTRYRLAPADAELAADTLGDVLAPASGVRVQIRPEAFVAFRLVYPADFTSSDRSADVRVDVGVRGSYRQPSPRWDGDAGTFRVPGGEDATVAITVIHCLTVWKRVRVRPGETFDMGEIRPERAGEFAALVVNPAGEPVVGAAALCTSADWIPRQVTDYDGRFRFDRVPRAGCTVVVDADGFVPLRLEARGDSAEPVTLKLQRGGLLWIACENAACAKVRVSDEGNQQWTFVAPQLDVRGECAARLPPGKWKIDVAGCAPVTAEVREGATTSVRFAAAAR